MEILNAPPVVPLESGLFTAAVTLDVPVPRWGLGPSHAPGWNATACDPKGGVTVTSPTVDCAEYALGDVGDLYDLVTMIGFRVDRETTCGLVGMDRPQYEADSESAAIAREEHAAETILVGATDGRDVIAGPTGGFPPLAALGILEQWLAGHVVGAGVVHVPASVLPSIAVALAVKGTQLVTRRGNRVSVGAYEPLGQGELLPDGFVTGMLATGSVVVARGPVAAYSTVAGGVADNTLTNRTSRELAIGWECGSASVPVNLLAGA